MSNPADIDDLANWDGDYHELCLELDRGDDVQLQRTLDAVVRVAGIRASRMPTVAAELREHDGARAVTGRYPGGPIVCGLYLNEFPEEGLDQLTLFLPGNALDRIEQGSRSLEWLTGIARETYPESRFRLAVIGVELDYVSTAELAGRIPEKRGVGYLMPVAGELLHFPAND
ncbi:hypothetical protein D5S17_28035 [Pseudonocardiaceae bacterium YIM PH 21723]|nr:hypothetical protein D5S17_28035 [Pseudonocardiaceae bacterium YIM PH 21723]